MSTRTDPTWMIAGVASVMVHAAAGYGLYIAPRIGDDGTSPQQTEPGQIIVLPPAERTVELPAPKPESNPSPSASTEPTAKPQVPPANSTPPVPIAAVPPQVPESEMIPLGTDNGQDGVKRWLEANADGKHVAIPGPDDQAGLTRRSGAVGVQPGQPGPVGTRGQGGEAGQGGQQGQAGSGGASMSPPNPALPQEAESQTPAQPLSPAANTAPPPPNPSVPLPPPPQPAATAPAAASRPLAANAAGPLAMPVEAQAVPAAEEQFPAATKDQAKSPLQVGADRPGAAQPVPMQDPKLPGDGAPVPPDTRTAPTDKPTSPTPPTPEQRDDTTNTPPRPELPTPPAETKPTTKPPETSFGPLDLLLEETPTDSKRSDTFTPPLVLLPSIFDEAMKRATERKASASQPAAVQTASTAGGQPGAPGNAGKPGIPGDPGDTAAADAGEPGLQSDRESDAFSTAVGEYRAGKVLAGKGIEIRPTRPKFGLLARTLALPAPPRVEVVFGRNGTVKRARIVRSSGYTTEIDEPIINAVYEWTASGRALAELPPNPSAEMRLNLTVYLR